MMKLLQSTSLLDGGNAAYLEQLFEDYLQDPASVDPKWRVYFDTLPRSNGSSAPDVPHSVIREQFYQLARQGRARRSAPGPGQTSVEHERKQIRVLQLINSYRFHAHQTARLDPLDRQSSPDMPELTLNYHQLSEADMDTVYQTGSFFGLEEGTLREIIGALEQTYCGSVGAEYMHMTNTVQKRWLQQRIETARSRAGLTDEQRRWLLQRLTAAEGLERYLHSKYVGQKRFSLEGGESFIPLLNELVDRAGNYGVLELVVAMAHRGRLNCLVNIIGKTPADLFAEFEGRHQQDLMSGDVKYHQGFSSDVRTSNGNAVHLTLAFNPSHLEIVGPVAEGSVRARQDRHGDREGKKVLPVIVHGDSAFIGQGVVQETFNMSQSRGYSTKGTVHIVINNQIGFTTSNSQDTRSTLYCSDIAKMVEAPIFHVNGDDPEAVMFVTQLAMDYRNEFQRDVVIDLVCYRRHGHNEADEPSATQPMMYKAVKALPTTRKLYADQLEQAGVIAAGGGDEMVALFRDQLDAGECVAPNIIKDADYKTDFTIDWSTYFGSEWNDPCDTRVELETIRDLAARLQALPEQFELHPRVAKIMDDRRKMAAGALPLDWGFAETMAYATLLKDGHGVRLSGQDCGRGTFFHRHAVLHNQLDGASYVPLRNLFDDQPDYLVIDSLLSEEAVLAFEYGYATADPHKLVIWEAQFGDFANGAQVVIDQFISSGESKWGRLCGLVMFLPHGYEGQGPEHSSARLERYLQLCAEHNIQVCMPTTPAQAYHMLRRQMLRPYRKPLVVMTPKSLLRHKLAVSTLEDLSEGGFQSVIPEVDDLHRNQVRRAVLCSGKVYYDLLERRRAESMDNVAIIRIEQLYPFPAEDLTAALSRYEKLKSVVWCQEEPQNQGSWYSTRHHLQQVLGKKIYVEYTGRPASASPAVGYASLHAKQQKQLVEDALGLSES